MEENVRRSFLMFLQNFARSASKSPEGLPTPSSVQRDAGDNTQNVLVYVEQLVTMKQAGRTTLYVDFRDVEKYDSLMAHEAILPEYFRYLPAMRKAVQNFVQQFYPAYVTDEETGAKEFYVSFYNLPELTSMRQLKTERIGQLVTVCGTVTRTSEVRPELLFGRFECLDCGKETDPVEQQFKYTVPATCTNPTCGNRAKWALRRAASAFVDWQRVRVQENAEEVPAGCLPRTLDVVLRHEAVETARAGDKCAFTGTLVAVPDAAALATPGDRAEARSGGGGRAAGGAGDGVGGLKALGVRELTYKLCFIATSVNSAAASGGAAAAATNIREDDDDLPLESKFTPAELAEVERMRADPAVYAKLIKSVAPAVHGADDIKKAVLLMLFGGVHKTTAEGISLRGDINVLVVGDPSCAKSQFLKYVAGFLPRAVYTSGKSSSAAGLTATVAKEPETGEFCLEAGALMLADNGICCIDEFDKMDAKDQVAIHEAMEQQTISIAKAGIQATLNARTSILAAANPAGGRYDRSRPLRYNVNLPGPILSRFDLVHVLIDEPDDAADYAVARHIVRVHQRKVDALTAEYTAPQLQRYIKWARCVKPTLPESARALLVASYVRLRQRDAAPGSRSAYPITVRQLEAMVRLCEALARAHGGAVITKRHVREAFRLVSTAIVAVDVADVNLDDVDDDGVEGEEEDAAAEDHQGVTGEGGQGGTPPTHRGGASQPPRAGRKSPRGAPVSAATPPHPGVDDDAAAEEAAGDARPPPARPQLSVSYDKYEAIKALLLRHLRAADKEALDAAAAIDPGDATAMDDAAGGVTQSDLVAAYLADWAEGQRRSGADTGASATKAEGRLVRSVIQHLVGKDAALLVLATPEVAPGPAEARRRADARLLALHPSAAAPLEDEEL